jgi:IclR family transcriptional regulator, acetate operon repressor
LRIAAARAESGDRPRVEEGAGAILPRPEGTTGTERPGMSALERGLAVLELLAAHPEGMAVGAIAAALDLPPSGTHRLLNQLVDYGFVHQDGTKGDYALSMKLAALGLAYLGQSGVTEVAQPILDRLAATSRELVRLSVVDGGNLVWVAVAQGATSGLRYDPGREQGVTAHLATSSSGLAWLATLTDDAALMKVAAQGFRQDTSGPAAFDGPAQFLAALAETRARGYSITIDTFMPGMAAMAAPVVPPERRAGARRHLHRRSQRALHRGAHGRACRSPARGDRRDGPGRPRLRLLPPSRAGEPDPRSLQGRLTPPATRKRPRWTTRSPSPSSLCRRAGARGDPHRRRGGVFRRRPAPPARHPAGAALCAARRRPRPARGPLRACRDRAAVMDVEIVRLKPETEVAAFRPFLERAQALGARHVLVAGDDPDLARLTDRFAELCALAAPHGLTADLEFMPWTRVPDLATARTIVEAAGAPNGGVLVDALHFDRSTSTLAEVAALPPALVNYVQLCDGPAEYDPSPEGLAALARTARLMPGEGAIDLVGLARAFPPGVTVSVEVPNLVRDRAMSPRETAARALASARTVLRAAERAETGT